MSTAKRQTVDQGIEGMVCNTASIADGALMVQDASNDNAVTQSAISAPTEAQETFIGLAMTTGATISSGNVVDIVKMGKYAGIAGGTITRGNLVTSNGDGTLIAAAPATGVNVWVIGKATESAVSGQRFAVEIHPFVYQGH